MPRPPQQWCDSDTCNCDLLVCNISCETNIESAISCNIGPFCLRFHPLQRTEFYGLFPVQLSICKTKLAHNILLGFADTYVSSADQTGCILMHKGVLGTTNRAEPL